MRKNQLFPILLLLLTLAWSCSTEEKKTVNDPGINVELTPQEIAGGVMTPEIMWKFVRVGTVTLSPDGNTAIYSATLVDLPTEARSTNLFSIPVTGGDATQITTMGGDSPQWYSGGGRLAFVKGGNLWSMNPDGTDRKSVV